MPSMLGSVQKAPGRTCNRRRRAVAEEIEKIEYKATYWPKDQNPFALRPRVLSRTAKVDASLPFEEVERLAREAGNGDRLISVEAAS